MRVVAAGEGFMGDDVLVAALVIPHLATAALNDSIKFYAASCDISQMSSISEKFTANF